MTNKNDIVFADGSVIKSGRLEYIGSTFRFGDYVVHEFKETRFAGDDSSASEILIQMQKETKEDD